MDNIYTNFYITTLPKGKALIRLETNDNNDDGIPDGYVDVWEHKTELWIALELAGETSHKGLYGQPVNVFLDGKRITKNVKEEVEA